MDKSEIRKNMRQLRSNMSFEEVLEKSKRIFQALVSTDAFKEAEGIYTYVNTQNEPDTIMLIDYSLKCQKQVFVPKVDGKNMDFYEISCVDELTSGYMGIYEPIVDGKKPDKTGEGLFIMPGVAFDKNLNRIGYGGGFYDRYLEKYPDFYKIAICYDFQVIDNIPTEDTDIKPDYIITERQIYGKH